MARPENTDAIAQATQRSWANWVDLLADNDESHATLVTCAAKNMPEDMDKKGWWSQAVAVAYEQHVGRRQPGQRLDCQYEVSVSKAINIDRATLAAKWLRFIENKEAVRESSPKNLRTSSTDIREYVRADVADAKFESAIESKSDDKSLLVVTMSELSSDDERSAWRDYWKNQLSEFVKSL